MVVQLTIHGSSFFNKEVSIYHGWKYNLGSIYHWVQYTIWHRPLKLSINRRQQANIFYFLTCPVFVIISLHSHILFSRPEFLQYCIPHFIVYLSIVLRTNQWKSITQTGTRLLNCTTGLPVKNIVSGNLNFIFEIHYTSNIIVYPAIVWSWVLIKVVKLTSLILGHGHNTSFLIPDSCRATERNL